MLVNIILLAVAGALILKALRFKVQILRMPVPEDAPRGLFGWHVSVLHLPRGVTVTAQTRCERAPRDK